MADFKYRKWFYKWFRKQIVRYMDHNYNISATGVENIPEEGHYLMVGNHLNILDAALLAKYDDSLLRFMVDEKLYKNPFSKLLFQSCGTFGTNPKKGNNVVAVANACRLLRKYNVVIFPEGMTHAQDEHVAFKPGFAGIAKVANVPILPFGINGTYEKKTDLQLNIGEPIYLEELGIPKTQYDDYIEKKVRALEVKR